MLLGIAVRSNRRKQAVMRAMEATGQTREEVEAELAKYGL